MPAEVVLVDHLAHVLEDFVGRGDRLADPRLEGVAERVQVAVRADAGVAVHPPRAAEIVVSLQHDETAVAAFLCHVPGRADAGNAGADDEHVEMFGAAGRGCFFDGAFERGLGRHAFLSDNSCVWGSMTPVARFGKRAGVPVCGT